MSAEMKPSEISANVEMEDKIFDLVINNGHSPIDVEFEDVSYSVPHAQTKGGSKRILRNISGKFKAGQLTAILGPSGSGKTTLLNILAGYNMSGTSGSILINGEQREMKDFGKISRYIMQDDLVQPFLSVEENMMIAARLKLGKNTPDKEKLKIITEILHMLRLSGARKTDSQLLSGGEKKRLSIALELINNPPVIFLDEPTTGLDDSSCYQCISLLKQLSQDGRTIICSIHTPSARLFSMFDNVYVMSYGQCAYLGYGPHLVEYLANMGIVCPTNYNPADFMIDLCCGEYGDFQEKFVLQIQNGKQQFQSQEQQSTSPSPKTKQVHKFTRMEENPQTLSNLEQFILILFRMWTQMWRNKSHLMVKLAVHIIMGLLIGNIYIGIAQDATKSFFNFGFYFNCIILFMFVWMMPVLLSLPMEIHYLKRERFNRWYNLGPYFCALNVAVIPWQVGMGLIYIVLIYLLSSQPLEWHRAFFFTVFCLLTGFVSESLGLVLGTTVNARNGSFLGPAITIPFIQLSTYGMGEGYAAIPLFMKILMHFSYLRYAVEGVILVMMGNREPLPCPEDEEFCRFMDLEKFRSAMAMENAVLWVDLLAMVVFLVVLRGLSFYLLRQRLTPNKTFTTLRYVNGMVKSYFS